MRNRERRLSDRLGGYEVTAELQNFLTKGSSVHRLDTQLVHVPEWGGVLKIRRLRSLSEMRLLLDSRDREKERRT